MSNDEQQLRWVVRPDRTVRIEQMLGPVLERAGDLYWPETVEMVLCRKRVAGDSASSSSSAEADDPVRWRRQAVADQVVEWVVRDCQAHDWTDEYMVILFWPDADGTPERVHFRVDWRPPERWIDWPEDVPAF